ncbi:MAG TPA: hypothetical protein VFY73_29810 [Ideonella sp.]|uniref:hypothetical protein n=1 Tax=Ideonella sp. TaxID=1929293 RepID=UPI002E308067|nr:hypothetical protein [Ideonella sp.]HEX5688236.1 hypothetical protein [Ideonella sp.]
MHDDAETISVFSFRFYDGHSERPEIAPFKATREAIAGLRGEVIEGTEQQVARSELDADGHFRRIPTGWGELS